jgi:chemotaxis protein MotB
MKNMISSTIRNLFYLFLCLLFLSACVSNKKYQEATLLKNHYKEQAETLRRVEAERDELAKRLQLEEEKREQTKDQLSEISLDLVEKNTQLEATKKTLNQRNSELDDWKERYQNDKKRFEEREENAQKAYTRLEKEKERLFYLLGEKRESLDSILYTYEDSEVQLMAFHRWRDKQVARMKDLRLKLEEGVGRNPQDSYSLESDSLSLKINLPFDLLFEENGDALSAKGKKSLRKLARILKTYPEFEFGIVGHTSAAGSTDNQWNACLTRATQVTEVLTSFGLPAEKLTASSRGANHPVASEESPEGQRANKRTEIMISPGLEQLLQLLY